MEDLPKGYANLAKDNKYTIKKDKYGILIHLKEEESLGVMDDKLLIFWDEQQKAWVGSVNQRLLDNLICGAMDFDYGPYKLNNDCAQIIRDQYRIPKEKLTNEQILHTEPSDLEKLAVGK